MSAVERRDFLRGEVVVEEKLDGANVAIYRDERGILRGIGRSGAGSQDRGGQFGRLKAWLGERTAALAQLGERECIFGEWLYRTHSVRYENLPELLVVIDWFDSDRFMDSATRDARAGACGLPIPPFVHRGRLSGPETLQQFVGPSAFGAEMVEGFVLRTEMDGRTLARAKWVRPGFVQKADSLWDGGVNLVGER